MPGWGAKSAPTVLARYERLEAIPRDVSKWEVGVRGAAKLAAALRGHWEDALLFRTLATLRTDVPLAESVDGCPCITIAALSPTSTPSRLLFDSRRANV